MLSLQVIKSGKGLSSYYSNDNYYAKDSPEGREASVWVGRGTKAFGVEGKPVDGKLFDRVMEGITPDGEQLGRKVDGEIQHRAGMDLTFSAPKSVSIMALVAEDKRLIEAHDRAVKAVLERIEDRILQTRVFDKQLKRQVRMDGTQGKMEMVAAVHREEMSRNNDPQLHSHVVIANMVRFDGVWRSMDNNSLFTSSMELGAAYRAELAMNVQELGYNIEQTHKDGRFELAGFPKKVIKEFSTRAEEIREAMKEYTKHDAKAAQNATLMTRAKKSQVEKAVMLPQWKERGLSVGFDGKGMMPNKILDALDTRSPLEQRAESLALADDALDYAIRHLEERASVFTLSDVRLEANKFGLGKLRPEAVDKAVEKTLGDGRLLESTHRLHKDTDMVTTRQGRRDELETIARMRGHQDGMAPMVKPEVVAEGLRKSTLNDGQRGAVEGILTGKERIVGVQGSAGVGKTTLLRETRYLAMDAKLEMMGLAPSASAARTMQEEAGIPSMTLQKFLGQYAGYAEGRGTAAGKREVAEEYANKIIVLDESSLAGTRQVRDLLRIIDVLKPARLVMMGDKKQLDAVEAGKPFAQLQSAGMKTLNVREIVRQKNPNLKKAVEDSLRGSITKAFERIGDNIQEVGALPKSKVRYQDAYLVEKTFEAWERLSAEERAGTGVVALTHDVREALKDRIREHLESEGVLRGREIDVATLKSAGYTRPELELARNFFAKDRVVFNRTFKRLGVKQGDLLTVIGKDMRNNTVRLLADDGRTVDWKLEREKSGKHIDILREGTLNLRCGDMVRFTRNDERLGIVNSEMAQVEKIGYRGKLTLRLAEGGKVKLGKHDLARRFMDHAYASTVHAFQGKTVDRIIGVLQSKHPHLTNQKAFYTTISRARHEAILVTDDRTQLGETLMRQTGARIAALEAAPKGMEKTTPSMDREPIKSMTKDQELEL